MQKKNENKKNKKVVVVAAMALLLALVGISGGETYAKYASSKDLSSATATVAKWGYVLSVNSTKLFGESYSNKDSNNLCTPLDSDSGVNVNASMPDENIVAPGTTGNFTISVNGAAEVLSKITTTIASGTKSIILENDGTSDVNYEPIRWTITGDYKINGDDKSASVVGSDLTMEKMLEKLDSLDVSVVNPNEQVIINLNISWTWKFESGNDNYDTMLGDLIALNPTELANKYGTNVPKGKTELGFGFDILVEQIQNS